MFVFALIVLFVLKLKFPKRKSIVNFKLIKGHANLKSFHVKYTSITNIYICDMNKKLFQKLLRTYTSKAGLKYTKTLTL